MKWVKEILEDIALMMFVTWYVWFLALGYWIDALQHPKLEPEQPTYFQQCYLTGDATTTLEAILYGQASTTPIPCPTH